MNAIRFTADLPPHAQMRARHCAMGGRTRTYKATRQAREEQALVALIRRHAPAVPLDVPLLLGVRAYLPVPKSKPQYWRRDALAGVIRPTSKPDMDNLLKHLKDCMSQAGYWRDDCLVVGYLPHTGKYYGAPPRWEIELVPWQARQT